MQSDLAIPLLDIYPPKMKICPPKDLHIYIHNMFS